MVSKELQEHRKRACAENFIASIFKKPATEDADLLLFQSRYLPPEYNMRKLTDDERLNTLFDDDNQVLFALRHFEVGLRLPLWPEYCQILRFYGIVPAQIVPNGVAMIVAYLCFLRSEGIAFDLSVFRRIFAIGATAEGVIFFSTHLMTIVGTRNKEHRWRDRLVVLRGDFGDIPRRPTPAPETAFQAPYLSGDHARLRDYFRKRSFDVILWRGNVDKLPYVHTGEGYYSLFLK